MSDGWVVVESQNIILTQGDDNPILAQMFFDVKFEFADEGCRNGSEKSTALSPGLLSINRVVKQRQRRNWFITIDYGLL